MSNKSELILGGTRSGKSRYAEQQVIQSGLNKVYIATAQSLDDEMEKRIALHQKRRASDWLTIEEPLALSEVLIREARSDRCILVDCLTLWLSNLLDQSDERLTIERAKLIESLQDLPGRIILVSNEVGLGIVSMNPLTRRFVDEAGWLHQNLAAICQRVVLITAGLPQILKGNA